MPYIGRTLGQGTRSRFLYTATAGQTTFSGSDTQSNTLAYADNNGLDCFQNGVLLKGGGADYTATSGTSVVLTTGASVSDVIEILVYDVFAIADHVKKSGDAMTGALTNIDVNGTELILDADGDTSITSDTDDRVDIKVGGSDKVHITSTGLGIGTSSPSNLIELDAGSGTDSGITIRMGTGNSGANDSFIGFENSAGSEIIRTRYDNPTTSYVISSDTSGDIMSVTRDGTILMNKNARSLNCIQQIAYNGGSQQGLILENTNNSQAGGAVRFIDSDGDFSGGGIFYTDSNSISYTTSSDYRLKENIVTDWDATTDLKKLKPSKFNFKKTPSKTVQGFIAHEVSSIVSEAISGTKDGTEKDIDDKAGKEKTRNAYQSIDQSKLVPLLTKALQEAVAKIETLEAKVTALEGK